MYFNPILFLFFISSFFAQPAPKNFIFFGRDRERLHDSIFINTKHISGAQIVYTWRQLEPKQDKYDFSPIDEDLEFLKSIGKRLFIQLQDVSFDSTIINVPQYIIDDPEFEGGISQQYEFLNENETKYTKEGWVAKRWVKPVRERFHKIIQKLAEKYDGEIEGMNLPESSIDFGSGPLHPKGFTYEKYRDAIKENMRALKESFKKSVCIQYINFMPGEFLPWTNLHLMESLYQYAKEKKVGVGGPDLKVYKKAQMNNSYGMIKDCAGITVTGVAVQDGNYDHINPQTNKKVTIPEIYEFGKDYLRLNYIFWCIEEPYYSKGVLPFLETQ